ncbi:MAG: hypothetical protein RL115_1481 [Bacteroidota bacterium]|jgi:2-polyprenyl-3-methyl-5-hydroxy-6-metoxy-1,4-benzoquinol methylase
MPFENHQHFSSFRDPAGYIYVYDKTIYRSINYSYKEHYDYLISSGCYASLTTKKLLIPHEEVASPNTVEKGAYKTIKPAFIPFITYPYEWGFEAMKAAATTTLLVMEEALKFGLIIKDANPYNVQWYNGKWVFIDTLSFEKFSGKPWVAYRQFCETFLGPLLLMQYRPFSTKLFLAYPDGIPLQTVSSLLPLKAKFRTSVFLHIVLHSKAARSRINNTQNVSHLPLKKLSAIVDNLINSTNAIKKKSIMSSWSGYYQKDISSESYIALKKEKIIQWLQAQKDTKTLLDIGCNTGTFSLLGAQIYDNVYAVDSDEECIKNLAQVCKSSRIHNIHSLVVDLANPTPAIGFNNKERTSFLERVKGVDAVLALAVIHHLVIGRNIPFAFLVDSFSHFTSILIIEYVGKNDPKVKMLEDQKLGITHEYSEEAFLAAFSKYFMVLDSYEIPTTERKLYLMKRVN